MKRYIDVIGEIEKILNMGKGKKKPEIKPFLIQLKTNYGIGISKEFLKNLIDEKEKSKKTAKVNHLLRKEGINSNKEEKIYWEEESSIKEIDTKNFFYDKQGNIKVKVNPHIEVARTGRVGKGKRFDFLEV